MKRTVVLNVVGLTSTLIGKHTPNLCRWMQRRHLSEVMPVLPAVTCSVQATFLTGLAPAEHGIVANGWFDRQDGEIKFWKQSNRLIQGPKIWDVLRDRRPKATVANVCWWYNMHTDVDYAVTPRPQYKADGLKVPDMATRPASLRDDLRQALGEFPLFQYWGPTASIKSSQWIANAAMWLETHKNPDLSLVYLPHLDYPLQIHGPDVSKVSPDLEDLDRILGQLFAFFEKRNVEVIVLSEYAISAVTHPIHLNKVLREHRWLVVRDEGGQEHLDVWNSHAFAVVDHQVAHVYIQNGQDVTKVADVLRQVSGVEQVLDRAAQQKLGICHERSGDLVVVASENHWFTYYYWLDDNRAPDFARTVDIHRKPGYDPVELFFTQGGKGRAGLRLLQRKMGQRVLMDIIGVDASVVQGSHGRVDPRGPKPVFISSTPRPAQTHATEVFNWILQHVLADDQKVGVP